MDGNLELRRAQIVSEHAIPLADDHYGEAISAGWSPAQAQEAAAAIAGLLEDHLLRRASKQSPKNLGRSARKAVMALDPGYAERHRKGEVRGRYVNHRVTPDGMGDLFVHLPAPEAMAVYGTIDAYARLLRSRGDARTLDELRADTLTYLVLHGHLPEGAAECIGSGAVRSTDGAGSAASGEADCSTDHPADCPAGREIDSGIDRETGCDEGVSIIPEVDGRTGDVPRRRPGDCPAGEVSRPCPASSEARFGAAGEGAQGGNTDDAGRSDEMSETCAGDGCGCQSVPGGRSQEIEFGGIRILRAALDQAEFDQAELDQAELAVGQFGQGRFGAAGTRAGDGWPGDIDGAERPAGHAGRARADSRRTGQSAGVRG